jgi:hypothetical protein
MTTTPKPQPYPGPDPTGDNMARLCHYRSRPRPQTVLAQHLQTKKVPQLQRHHLYLLSRSNLTHTAPPHPQDHHHLHRHPFQSDHRRITRLLDTHANLLKAQATHHHLSELTCPRWQKNHMRRWLARSQHKERHQFLGARHRVSTMKYNDE